MDREGAFLERLDKLNERLGRLVELMEQQGRALHHLAGCASELLMRWKAPGERPAGPPERKYLGGGKPQQEPSHDEAPAQTSGRPRAGRTNKR
jgi:hypothetical protein